MFLSKLPEETVQNRQLARRLVDTWSRPIFEKSVHYRDLREHYEDEREMRQREREAAAAASEGGDYDSTPVKSRANIRVDDDAGIDLTKKKGEEEGEGEGKGGSAGKRRVMTRVPQPMAMDFRLRPESKVSDEEAARMGGKEMKHQNVMKKLQKMGGSKGKVARAEKMSIQGRGMVKYF